MIRASRRLSAKGLRNGTPYNKAARRSVRSSIPLFIDHQHEAAVSEHRHLVSRADRGVVVASYIPAVADEGSAPCAIQKRQVEPDRFRRIVAVEPSHVPAIAETTIKHHIVAGEDFHEMSRIPQARHLADEGR